MFFKNKNSNTTQMNNLVTSIKLVEQEAKLRIASLEAAILHLDLDIMDENDVDATDEARRQELRPLTRELMNQMKTDRNLSKLMLQEIAVAEKAGTMYISERFTNRFTKVSLELSTIQMAIMELGKQFVTVSPGIIEKYFKGFD